MTTDANVRFCLDLGQFAQVLSGNVDEGVEVVLVLEQEHSARILTGKLSLANDKFMIGEFNRINPTPGTPLPHQLKLLKSNRK